MKKKSPLEISASEFRKNFISKNGIITEGSDEAAEQAHVCKYVKDNYPNVLYTVDLAGLDLSPAQRKIYKTRCKRGHPDLMFQEWYKDRYCGLAIEMKAANVPLTMDKIRADKHLSEQLEYLKSLDSRGYIAGFACGKDAAIKIIDAYLEAAPNSLDIINRYLIPKIKF